jgi:cell division septum initiation protein DivIVA
MSNSRQTQPAGASDPSGDHEELTEQIQQTRDELGAAVHELAAKADVKQRITDQAGQQAERLRETARRITRQANRTRGALADQVVEPASEMKDAVAADSRTDLVLAVMSVLFAVLAAILILRRRSDR